MKSHLAWCLLIAAVAAYPVSAGGADQPPKRVKATCARDARRHRAGLEEHEDGGSRSR